MLVLPALASLQTSNVGLGEASHPDRHCLSLSAAAHIKVRQTTGIALPKGMIPAYLLLSLLSCQLIEYKIWKLEMI